MKLGDRPINGSRPICEFVYGGEIRLMPDPKLLMMQCGRSVFNLTEHQVLSRNGGAI